MRTLLLNPWMAPHKIISWERAVVLVVLGKVDVIEEYDEEVRSRNFALRTPAVVRLKTGGTTTKPSGLATWDAILARCLVRATPTEMGSPTRSSTSCRSRSRAASACGRRPTATCISTTTRSRPRIDRSRKVAPKLGVTEGRDTTRANSRGECARAPGKSAEPLFSALSRCPLG